jgi:23S rRNA (cytosine1962-C5)-methyltransferase
MTAIPVLTPEWPEYELLDSGESRKLERFGKYLIVRHEPKAWWRPALPEREWARAHAVQDEAGRLTISPRLPAAWPLRLDLPDGRAVVLEARVSETSRHIGLFPEQAPHWRLLCETAAQFPADGPRPRLLNLFGYTGAASLAAQAAGFAATHVDASRPAIAWAKRNQELTCQAMPELRDRPVRFLLDDVAKLVAREQRRGSRYEAILLDPPSFGRGPNREVWKVESMVRELLCACRELLSERAALLLLTMYNIEASALMLGNLLDDVLGGMSGSIAVGELAVPHAAAPARLLPRSLFARWRA